MPRHVFRRAGACGAVFRYGHTVLQFGALSLAVGGLFVGIVAVAFPVMGGCERLPAILTGPRVHLFHLRRRSFAVQCFSRSAPVIHSCGQSVGSIHRLPSARHVEHQNINGSGLNVSALRVIPNPVARLEKGGAVAPALPPRVGRPELRAWSFVDRCGRACPSAVAAFWDLLR